MGKFIYILLIIFFTALSCNRIIFTGPYKESKSDCGKLVLKLNGKAILTKCGEIMWNEEGSWEKKNDTVKIQFRNQWDNKVFLVKKRKFYRIVNDSTIIKHTKKINIEK